MTHTTCSKTDIRDHLTDFYSKSCQNLTSDQQQIFKQLLIDNQNTFSKSSHDLGRTDLVQHTIYLVPGTKLIKQHPYRLPLAKRKEAENEINNTKNKVFVCV